MRSLASVLSLFLVWETSRVVNHGVGADDPPPPDFTAVDVTLEGNVYYGVYSQGTWSLCPKLPPKDEEPESEPEPVPDPPSPQRGYEY